MNRKTINKLESQVNEFTLRKNPELRPKTLCPVVIDNGTVYDLGTGYTHENIEAFNKAKNYRPGYDKIINIEFV